jgi:hypothetical protein
VEVRSVSPRTVLESENAMAARAAESHKTASNALPRLEKGSDAFFLFPAKEKKIKCV